MSASRVHSRRRRSGSARSSWRTSPLRSRRTASEVRYRSCVAANVGSCVSASECQTSARAKAAAESARTTAKAAKARKDFKDTKDRRDNKNLAPNADSRYLHAYRPCRLCCLCRPCRPCLPGSLPALYFTVTGSFGISPNISGEYRASTRVVGRLNSPGLLTRKVYSTDHDPFGMYS